MTGAGGAGGPAGASGPAGAGQAQDGPLMFVRYAYPPNALG